jgi:hypothetical protein
MTTSEKVAYLKGLAEGLGLDKETKEGKLFSVIIDVLDDIATDLEDLEENALDLGEEIDALSDDLAEVEDVVYECCGDEEDDDADYDDEDDCCCCGHDHDEDAVFYEVTCPACNNTITVDEDVLDLGSIACPSCGETLEFDLDEIEDEENGDDEE